MKLVVGLGNPGKKYDSTRHNVGFRVIDILSKKFNINIDKIKNKGFQGDGTIESEKVILLKPQTFMNLSGESVKDAITFYKIPIEDLIVIYDDVSIPPGATRIREKGSAGGHNGMKNIIQHLGSDAFLRIKVGIGEKPNGWDLADYVLSKFTKDEEPLVVSGCEMAAKAVETIIKDGISPAMNLANTPRVKKQKEAKTDKADNADGEDNK